MADVAHQWGSDLMPSPTGDLAAALGTVLGQQRVLRRLLTNPGDYIWQPDYGAGLARFIGQPANEPQIAAVVRSQIFKELVVARNPEPLIEARVDSASGVVVVDVRYADAVTGETQVLSFIVGA